MIHSRITAKSQTTIPRAVRQALGVGPATTWLTRSRAIAWSCVGRWRSRTARPTFHSHSSRNRLTSSIRPTTIFEFGDIVRAPFPHVEGAVVTVRPALVVALRNAGELSDLLWLLMITNALRPGWPDDVPIKDAPARSLLIPSKVRTAKVSTIMAEPAVKLGVIDHEGYARVREIVLRAFAAH